ncbi:MAG: hypothetical protein ACON4U_14670 [Myxococcota bacterium]
MNLPVEIINAVKQNNCVLFAGPGFAREAIEALGKAIPDDLSLAKALGWKRPKRLLSTRKRRDAPDPSAAAQQLLQTDGRAAVLEIIRKELSLDDIKPTEAHRIGLAHFPLIISTASDELWVAASMNEQSYVIRDRGDDIGDIDLENPSIYHLWGRYSSVEQVTLDSGQKALPAHVSKQLKNLLRRKVIFFVGYRPDEVHFEHLWQLLSQVYGGELPRCHLAVAQGRIDDYLWQKWVWRGLLMFTADPSECFEVLRERLQNA